MTIEVTRLHQDLGAEVRGIEARSATASEAEALIGILAEHGVVVLRDQTLPPPDFVRFARLMGEIEFAVREQFWLPEQPEVYAISNIVINGRPIGNPYDGFMWHTDLNYMERPTAYTMLYAVETPAEGADTQFASTFRLYEHLTEDERARFDGLNVCHSHDRLHAARPNAAPLTEEQRRKAPDVLHPMVRTHPVTGRKAIYIGPRTLPVGLSEEEGDALVADLMSRATDPAYVYSHAWKPHDLVIWDNRGLLHRATEYDRARYRRLMHRVTVRGERPV